MLKRLRQAKQEYNVLIKGTNPVDLDNVVFFTSLLFLHNM